MLHDLEKHLSSALRLCYIILRSDFFTQIQSPERLFANSETWVNSGRNHPKQHGKSSLSHTGVFLSPFHPWVLSPSLHILLPVVINLELGPNEVQYLVPHYGH